MNEFFLKIINMSISASWLVLAVLILRLILKKAPKWVNVVLWGMVAIRLICPFSFESAFSLIPSAETIPEKVISGPSFDVQTGITPVDNRINEYLGDRYFEGVTVPADNGFNVMTTLAIVWGIGILILIAYTTISYFRLRRKLDTAVRYKDNIFQSENVASPFVLGIIKPKVYLPYHMDEQDLSHVVAHEQAHIRRRDHWWKPLGFLLLTIHWFNPLMWLAYVLLCRDIELACDEKVIKELGSEQRADYTQALVACSVNRRMIAACPLAFGEVGVKERVKSVMNYKKPAFWVVVLAVIACVVVAVCFLTNPAGTALTKWTIDEVDMNDALDDVHSMTVRYNGDSVSCSNTDSNRFIATMDKIRVGRNSISQSRDHNRDHSFTITINDNLHLHFSFDFSEMWVDNGVKPSFSYPITNPETARELMLDFSFTNRGATEQWFDYLDNSEEMQWDGRMEVNIPEFPDVTFRWYPEKMEAVTEDGITPLYTGMPIWNTYFCDLTGDGLPELCSTISWGSGMIDNRVIIYDYANGVSYSLEDRGVSDYTLRQNETDGQLYVDKTAHVGGGLLSTGRLVFEDECLQVLWPEKPNDTISDITDPTDDPNFVYNTAIEKIYEDERNEYFISGLYSQHIIVHYTDGTQEDIVTALNAGRATFADLDKFGIRYWVEPKEGTDAGKKEELLKIFEKSDFAAESVVATDCVIAADGAYDLDGVVQYVDETGAPWKLAFIRDGTAYPVSLDYGTEYAVASELTYLGNGVVQVYIENLNDGTVDVCKMAYSYDEAENITNFKATEEEYNRLTDKELARFNETFDPLMYDKQGNPVGLNEWRSPYPAMAKELQDAAADLATLKFEVMKKVGDAVGNVQAYKL